MKKTQVFKEFFIDGGDTQNSHILMTLTNPMSDEEAMKGHFFAFFETKNIPAKEIEKIQKIINEAEKLYFLSKSPSIAQSFSNATAHAKMLIESLNLNGAINGVVGVIDKRMLRFTTCGVPVIWVIFPHNRKLHIHDLSPGGIDSIDVFTNVIEGEIKLSNTLFITSQHFTSIVDKDRMLKIFKNKNVALIIKMLSKILEPLQNGVSYAGIFIEGNELDDEKNERAEIISNDTVHELHSKEKMTSKMLNPGFSISLAKIKAFAKNIHHYLSQGELKRERLKKMYRFASAITHQPGDIMRTLKSWYLSIGILGKISFACAILAFLFFGTSIAYLKITQEKRERNAFFEATIEQVAQKKNQIESSLIYNDDKSVRKHLKEARILISTIEPKNRRERKEIRNIEKSLDSIAMKIQKIETPNIKEVLNLNKIKFNGTRITATNNFIAVSGAGPQLLISNHDGADTKTAVPEQDSKNIKFITKLEDNGIIAANDSKLLHKVGADAQTELVGFNVSDAEFENAADLKFYADRIYTILPPQNQILVHRKQKENGFGVGELWNRDDINLSNAISISIDSNIYILFRSGAIKKMRIGKIQPFPDISVDPLIENAIKIATNENSNLFMLEAGSKKRIVEISKEGALIRQYASPDFVELRDIDITPDGNTLFVLDGSRVLKITLR